MKKLYRYSYYFPSRTMEPLYSTLKVAPIYVYPLPQPIILTFNLFLMEPFEILLREFDAVLRKYNPSNYAKLQDPLPDEQIEEFMKANGITEEAFRMLYQWKNGINYLKSPRCFITDEGAFISIESIARFIKQPAEDSSWKSSFIPLMMDNDGAALLFNNEKGEDYGRIHLFSVAALHIDEPISIYDSIETMVQTYVDAYKQGDFVYSAEYGDLDIEDEYYKIGGALNKQSKYWFQD
jgi:hypothetical protein